MASIKTTNKPYWYFQELAADDDGGCHTSASSHARQPLAAHQPKGDPLQEILELEQLALHEGFPNVHEYISYIERTHRGSKS
ncbi:MAG: hypothetical protein ACXWCQ_30840 [Burkholderiales bacterium]